VGSGVNTVEGYTAMHSFNIWSALGKPTCGVEFDNMRRDKLRYKLSLKAKERTAANTFSDSLNDALSNQGRLHHINDGANAP